MRSAWRRDYTQEPNPRATLLCLPAESSRKEAMALFPSLSRCIWHCGLFVGAREPMSLPMVDAGVTAITFLIGVKAI